MTTREIAKAVGRPEKTVRTWAFKAAAKSAEAAAKSAEATPSRPADWNLEETITIIEVGMGKNAAAIYRQNAEQNNQTSFAPSAGSTLTEKDLSLISTLTAGIVTQIFEKINGRVEKIEGVVDQRRALLPAPAVKPRDHINMIVREYARNHEIPHGKAWSELYRQFGYRTNTNPSQCAKNREMAILDYIEAEGMIDLLEAVALDVYGGAA